MPNCALDRRKNVCFCVSGFQRQLLYHVKNLSEHQRKERAKEDHRERPCCGLRLHFPKSTVRNVFISGFFSVLFEVGVFFEY